MKSTLLSRLKPEELQTITDHALLRLGEQRSARDALFEQPLTKWAKRSASDFSDRRSSDPTQTGSINDRKNESVQMVRNVRRFILARAWKDLYGSKPWFAAKPRGPHDPATASQIQDHAGEKLEIARWEEVSRGVIGTALDLGWCPVKTTWRTEEEAHETMEVVLCDKKGKPVESAYAEYIYPDDPTTVDEQQDLEGADASGMEATTAPAPIVTEVAPDEAEPVDNPAEDAAEPVATPETPLEAYPTGPTFLHAPDIELPNPQNGYQWKEVAVTNTVTIYDGLDFKECHWRDVAWDVLAAECDLTHCDQISHTRDMTLEQIRADYDPDGDNQYVQDILEKLKSGDTCAKAEEGKPKPERNEVAENKTDPENPTIKVTEIYRRHKILPKGPESRIFLCVAEEFRLPIWADYLASITPNAQCPIHLVPINRVSGRAYGIGLYEVYEMASEIVDKLTNSILLRNEYAANPIKLIDKQALQSIEGYTPGQTVKIGPDNWLVVNGKTVALRDLIHVLALPDVDERTWELMEMFRQLIQVESGVTNASQGELTDLPSNNTATGVNSLLESSSVLHQYTLAELKSGLTPPLQLAVELIYFKQTADDTYDHQGGGVLSLGQAQHLRQFSMNVEILLSRAKRQELREAAVAAIPLADAYYTMLMQNPNMAMPAMEMWATKTRPLRVQALRGLDIDDADTAFPTPEELQALFGNAQLMQQQQAQLQLQQGQGEAGAEGGQPAEAQEPQDGFPMPRTALPSNVIQ